MNCPTCDGTPDSKIVDTLLDSDGVVTGVWRQCSHCQGHFIEEYAMPGRCHAEKECADLNSRYATLIATFNLALEQASKGKGHQRHDDGSNFESQLICDITRRLSGSPVAFSLGQAVKKIYETVNLSAPDKQIHELLGALNYLAAAIIVLQEGRNA